MNTILITGASSGIGRATAELFLDQGWRVGLVARRAERLAEIADAHPNAVALPADVTDAAAMRAAFESFGHIDVLFNNAGLFGMSGPIDEIPLEVWTEVMQVNINGMFIAAQLAFEQMRKQADGGRIINNGSLSAYVPRPGSVCYTMSKHAVTGLTRTLSLDGRPFNIACGQIDIGNAESELVADLKAANPDMDTMDVKHAASSVLHMAQMPPEANVQFMTVMATKMPYIGRG
ncbi:SDR family oxidoreductase [Sulfitobacter sp. HGT1]|jgi:NAD(P)-dependent dehydrogenase (short-subunit alcohol dehydrogenase family)|uniref:SDR family oxidoreductase n=1 Tax=unclassified Sulfitobacter TaxID=196795 RepID=UPI0015948289|nr:SDR family oxidoreductase [Sulfitobacter sp. HGT1]MBQ0803642.1 SDR family oxidoreductase [Sulfitobacter sp.]